MGWGRFFLLGDLGQQLDLQEHQTAMSDLRSDQYRKDRSQDEQIADLQAEVVDLKRYVGRLCQLMIDKGLLPEDDIAKLATSVYERPGSK